MLKDLIRFLKGRYKTDAPILLAFSGGPDSLALLYLLLEFSKVSPVNLALAHVDHGWRAESAKEVDGIVKMAEKLKLPLHLKKLDPNLMRGNLEAACRNARLQFFAALCHEHKYQAVLLAHHADDLTETLLKRVLEGVTLPYLSSLSGEIEIYGMKVWRPLLEIPKTQILQWLEKRGLKGFDDVTNRDPKFLRAKFRLHLLPYLSKMFGKEISSGLCQIAKEAGELREYLDHQIYPYVNMIAKGKWGYLLDLSENKPKALFELKYLVRQFCKNLSVALSRECIAKAASFLQQNIANKCFVVGSGASVQTLYVDRGRLFLPANTPPALPDVSLNIIEGKIQSFGEWKVYMTTHRPDGTEKPSDWLSLWSVGIGEVILPKGDYSLTAPDSTFIKFWMTHKIPSFFRRCVPIVLKDGHVVHEFLTGNFKETNKQLLGEFIKLAISYR